MAAWATSNLFAAHEDVKIAEQDVEKAKAEYEQAQREVDAIIDDHLARAGQWANQSINIHVQYESDITKLN